MKPLGKPADFSKIQRLPIEQRTNLVSVKKFAKVPEPGSGFMTFIESLPMIEHRTNAAISLKKIMQRIVAARNSDKPVTWALGPHVIKYGLTPLIVELMENGLITSILTNGAGAIHDTEIALIGETSEEMAGHISTGTFGMAEETGEFLNTAARLAHDSGNGFGHSIGKLMTERSLPFNEHSLFAQAFKRDIPVTVHVALGTDIIHMHPDMNGAHTGAATITDFKIFTNILRRFKDGGVHLNVGSTVVLPEVFVKAITAANNLNKVPASGFTTANFDHLSEYRPLMNVVRRGAMDGGEGFEIIGRMEIMVPLLIRLLLGHLRGEN